MTSAVKSVQLILGALVLGLTSAGPCADSNLPDGQGVYIGALANYRDCKYLLQYYPEDKYVGIYAAREYYCTNITATDCCSACSNVLNEAKCKKGQIKDGNGVYVAGLDRYFDCKYLRMYYSEDNHVGIHENWQNYCNLTSTDCCTTCAQLVSEEECRKGHVADGKGVFVPGLDRYFDCKYLLKQYPEDKLVGVYNNREAYCKDPNAECCTSCAVISGDLVPTTRKIETTTSITPKITVNQGEDLKDKCTNNCLWIADGSYGSCNWLLDNVNHPDVFKQRFYLCDNGFATDCRRTCAEVLKNKPQAGVLTYGNNDTDIVVVPLEKSKTSTSAPQTTTRRSVTSSATDHIPSQKNRDVAGDVNTDSQVLSIIKISFDNVKGPKGNMFDVWRQSLEILQKEEEVRHRHFAEIYASIFKAIRQASQKR